MKLFPLLLSLAAAIPALAQEQSDPNSALNDEQRWTVLIMKTVPPGELRAAERDAASRHDKRPLLDLAAKYKLQPPLWLTQRIITQGESGTLASLGDSITAGTGSCSVYFVCPGNSWSTGDQPFSVMHQLDAGTGRDWSPYTAAIPGATMASIPSQAYAAFMASQFGLNIQRITLLIGHNDPGVCGADKDGAVSEFQDDYDNALGTLHWIVEDRGAKLFASSMVEVPSLARYENLTPAGADQTCRQIWDAKKLCGNVLDHTGDPAWLARVSNRVAEYNQVLADRIAGFDWALYTPTLNDYTMQGVPDPAADISQYDCFHPSALGQQALGRVEWQGQNSLPGLRNFFLAPSREKFAIRQRQNISLPAN